MRVKKSLGQHFLTSQGAVAAIINASKIKPQDTVLEIGPGRGVLTSALLETGVKVIAIEKDFLLIPLLKEKFEQQLKSKQLTLINQDILEFEPEGNYKLIANIPYNITGAIIEKFLTTKNQPSLMTLLVQKEVAERIVAKDGKESILSLSVKAYGTPKYVQTVKAGSFNPPPKVDSAILNIADISRKNFANNPPAGGKITEDNFFKVVKTGFAHKRKTISNNLKVCEVSLRTLEKCDIEPSERAENITLDQWICLTKHI